MYPLCASLTNCALNLLLLRSDRFICKLILFGFGKGEKVVNFVCEMKRLLIVLAGFLMVGCNSTIKDRGMRVTVSIAPLKWVVEQITGSAVVVDVLVPEAAGAENFDPTPRQVASLAESDIYFSLGLMDFEIALNDNVKAMGNNVRVVELKDAVDVIAGNCCHHGYVNGHDHFHSHVHGDPHIWLSVKNMRLIALFVLGELSSAYPDYSEVFKANAMKLDDDLANMDAQFSALFSGGEKVLIIHPSLSYLARDYSFRQVPVEIDGKEPSASYLKEIFDLIKSDGITSIYYSIQDNPAVAKAIASEAGIYPIEYDPLAHDWKGELIKLVNGICRK